VTTSSSFVGREGVMTLLGAALTRAVVDGQGATLVIRGDAGIGKSRVTLELEAVANTAGMRTLRGACFPGVPVQEFFAPDNLGRIMASTLRGLRKPARRARWNASRWTALDGGRVSGGFSVSAAAASAGVDELPVGPFWVCVEVLAHPAVPAILFWIRGIRAVAVTVAEYRDQDQLVGPFVGSQHIAGDKAVDLAPALLRPFIVHCLQLLLVIRLHAHSSDRAVHRHWNLPNLRIAGLSWSVCKRAGGARVQEIVSPRCGRVTRVKPASSSRRRPRTIPARPVGQRLWS
jgi:hypothetical protein